MGSKRNQNNKKKNSRQIQGNSKEIEIYFGKENEKPYILQDSTLIKDYKYLLQEKYQIKIKDYQLSKKYQELDDNKTFSKYQIDDNSIIGLVDIELQIQDHKKTIKVNPTTSIKDLQQKIKELDLENKNIDINTIIFNDQVLEEDKTLLDYQIINNSLIQFKQLTYIKLNYQQEEKIIKVNCSRRVNEISLLKDYKLFYKGEEIDNSQTFLHYNMIDGSIMEFKDININLDDIKSIKVNPLNKIYNIKCEPDFFNYYEWSYNGQQLDKQKTLLDYGIINDAKLEVSEIEIKLENNKTIKVLPSIPINQISQIKDYQLYYKETKIDNRKCLAYYQIQNQSNLEFSDIKITLQQQTAIRVNPCIPINQIEKMKDYEFYYHSTKLDKSKTLLDYGIIDNSNLNIEQIKIQIQKQRVLIVDPLTKINSNQLIQDYECNFNNQKIDKSKTFFDYQIKDYSNLQLSDIKINIENKYTARVNPFVSFKEIDLIKKYQVIYKGEKIKMFKTLFDYEIHNGSNLNLEKININVSQQGSLYVNPTIKIKELNINQNYEYDYEGQKLEQQKTLLDYQILNNDDIKFSKFYLKTQSKIQVQPDIPINYNEQIKDYQLIYRQNKLDYSKSLYYYGIHKQSDVKFDNISIDLEHYKVIEVDPDQYLKEFQVILQYDISLQKNLTFIDQQIKDKSFYKYQGKLIPYSDGCITLSIKNYKDIRVDPLHQFDQIGVIKNYQVIYKNQKVSMQKTIIYYQIHYYDKFDKFDKFQIELEDIKVNIEKKGSILINPSRKVQEISQKYEYQSLYYNKTKLDNSLTLIEQKIYNNSTLLLEKDYLSLYGTKKEFSDTAPKYRIVCKGLNIEGKCTNSSCEAYNNYAWSNYNYGTFNVYNLINYSKCPKCNYYLENVRDMGLYDCVVSGKGKQNGNQFDLKEKTYNNFYIVENSNSNYKEAKWKSLDSISIYKI